MVREKSEIWNYFEINGTKAICRFCRLEAFKNPSRMPVHLLKCKRCPDSIKARVSDKVSKSCLALCKNIPSMAPTIAKQSVSPKHSADSFTEECDYSHIPNIEIVNEDEEDAKDPYMSDPSDHRIKYVGVDESPYMRPAEESRILDEFSTFGDCVAHKLRNINNPQARSIAQYYINTILFRAEMTNFKEDFVVPSAEEFKLFDKLRKEDESLKESSCVD